MNNSIIQLQHDLLIKRLLAQKNPALNRLAEAVELKQSDQDVTNYSRMHHRHNRT